jgi:hypothetical protein
MSLARVEHEADLRTALVHGFGHVANQALYTAARVSETEQQLSRLVPESAGRLTAIADITAMGLAEIVAGTARRLER